MAASEVGPLFLEAAATPARIVLGSASVSMLHCASCSVLVIAHRHAVRPPDSAMPGPMRILPAFDGSAPADKAVELCASLPLQDQAAITLLTVMPLVTLYRQDIRQRLGWPWQERKEAAAVALAYAAARVGAAAAEVSFLVREHADVPGTILAVASEPGERACARTCAVLAVRG